MLIARKTRLHTGAAVTEKTRSLKEQLRTVWINAALQDLTLPLSSCLTLPVRLFPPYP